jgi:hypothetical protein
MGTALLARIAIGIALGGFAVLFAIVELARRGLERNMASARLAPHAGRTISWGEVWDHPSEPAGCSRSRTAEAPSTRVRPPERAPDARSRQQEGLEV